jgi:4-diphosphocytidyl-2-C-methyl-D-erythritol kinase
LKVVERAPAKVNLALHVLARRDDGYHLLDSIVAFADIGDELVFQPAREFSLAIEGPFAADLAADESNLVLKSARALARQWPHEIVPAAISLHKNLPVASGIGGGSADAAATIRGLLRLSGMEKDPRGLTELALQLGADVPVCLKGEPCRMQGIGENLAPLPHFPELPAVLVNPGIPLATAAVFSVLALERGAKHSEPIVEPLNPLTWRNDLERCACALSHEVQTVLATLQEIPGITKAGMSGSGATCYALFQTPSRAAEAAAMLKAAQPGWWVKDAVLS